jgi:hypothetical protein
VNAPARLNARAYPTDRAIRHVVRAARKLDIDVAGLEVSPDGTIRVVDARAIVAAPATLFDELETAGKL